jgi:hypothetical protein
MSDPESTPPLIFSWADREGSSWWLAAFIFLSFLLHSAAFFVFQGASPLTARAPRTAPTVQLLFPSSEPADRSPEANALLQWIATQDPALVAKIQTVEPGGLIDVPYRPSYLTVRTQPLGAPPEPPTIQFPPARDPLAMIRSLSPQTRTAPTAPAPQPTEINFSSTLKERLSDVPKLIPQTKADKRLQPTTLLIAVSGNGETRFAFLQQRSESPALDSEASAFVRTLRFAPGGGELQWGTVTFEWGDDAVAQPPAPSEPPR